MLNFIMLALVLMFRTKTQQEQNALVTVTEAEPITKCAEPKRPEQPQGTFG